HRTSPLARSRARPAERFRARRLPRPARRCGDSMAILPASRLRVQFHPRRVRAPSNAKCARYFTPEMNGLAQRWEGVCWMNPPYFQGRIGAWLAKAYHEVQENDCVVVAFVHSAFDTGW